MRLVLGLAIGFGVGFAGALLFAPDRSKGRQADWRVGTVEGATAAFEEDHNFMGVVKRALRAVEEQVSEAMQEAKRAQAEAERELRERYAREVRRDVGEPPKMEAEKSKAKEKKGK